jgi:putative radical SAM enzyme (TIGR03279 family)
MLTILEIEPDSIAAELGLQAGDRLLAINGEPLRDLLDYRVLMGGEELLLEIERADGELWEIEIDKDADEELGVLLPHPEPSQCGNNCIFCFVHQLPRGLRPTLYVKDEDYRFSFLYGAYVTLTNIDEAALQRILDQQLSPLYVSVHATDEELRGDLLGRRGPEILPLLRQLIDGGIVIHTQVVICPGLNDGPALTRTFADLVALAPGVASLALVPVGLTGYRQRLPQLRPVLPDEARTLLDWVHDRQEECLSRLGTRFVYAADELYLAAGRDFPELAAYEELPQLENGVGLIARFRAQADALMSEVGPLDLPPISVVTGESAAGEVRAFATQLAERSGCALTVVAVTNRFFGGHVTVTGLLTGRDIVAQLAGEPLGEILLLPEVLLREGSDLLLDDLTVLDLERQLGVRVETFPPDPFGLWDLLETLALERDDKE